MPDRSERYVVTALAFAVPAVWAGLGPGTALACVLAAAAAYSAAGSRSRLPAAHARLQELAARLEARRRPVPARRPPRTPIASPQLDEPSESAVSVSGYGW